MRPDELNPVFAEVQALEGIGPRMATLLGKALRLPGRIVKPRVLDLLWHLPSGIVDRSAQPSIADTQPGVIATLSVRVLRHKPGPPGNRRAPYRVTCEDETGQLDLVFFRGDRKFLERQLPVGQVRHVSGRVENYNNKLQMTHPDYILTQDELDQFPLIEPVYPLTAGLSNKVLQKAMRQALARIPDVDEWQDPAWLASRDWPDFATALQAMHHPEADADLTPSRPAWQRLAYDELLANQLALAIVRMYVQRQKGRPISGDGSVRKRILEALPYKPTGSQSDAMAEIEADMGSPTRMLRLLQGDVGSGKTLVAMLAMAIAIEAGAQAALLAPTEVLARQHAESLSPLAEQAGLTLALLTGREKGRPRKQILELLATGKIDILVGTHAIFQDDVEYKDLGLAVIDEQHRFGVAQRLALQNKGGDDGADVLVMTATPIPRTLLMTNYGDLEVSKLLEKPAGRKPIETRAVDSERIDEVAEGIGRAIGNGAQVYWVCPLVEGSDKLDLAAAEERHAYLKQRYGDRIGLVHGQMKGKDKDAVMAAFSAGELAVLVSTTVIEVGVNVPNATIMVIEHAERFGLAQLHQLRGRVGRGDAQSTCILLYQRPLSENAKARIEIMRESEDGFLLAEEDLRLRGGGEMLGTRQSGMPDFRIAAIPNFEELMRAANDDAKLIMTRDPGLKSERGQALKTLLYLFDRDDAVQLFRG